MPKVYAIISGKGGVGKTTTSINLGTALRYLGEDVIIVDANLTTPNIGIHLGAPIVPITLNHVLDNAAKVEDAIYEHETGTKIMPASLSLKDTQKINYKKLVNVTKKLKKISDHIILDSPAGLGEEARHVIDASDEIIIIANPEMASVTDALKTIKLAEEKNKRIIGVIITRYTGNKTDMSINNIKDMLEIPILGIIPEDLSIKESQIMKNAVINTHPKSPSSRNYIDASRRLLGEDVKINLQKRGIITLILKTLSLR